MSRFDFSRPLPFRRTRTSTYARDGSNEDAVRLAKGETWAVALEGAGEILHLWLSVEAEDASADYLTQLQVLAWFDGVETPQVNLPLGALFGLGHGRLNELRTAAFDVAKCDGEDSNIGAFNFWLPMPYSKGARLEFRNRTGGALSLGAYIDCASYADPSQVGALRFHATHRSGCMEAAETEIDGEEALNTTGEENYVLLDVPAGEGTYLGGILSVKSEETTTGEWYEGDDMIFIDGQSWPPALHGTGTEDYFNLANGVSAQFSGAMHGFSQFYPLPGSEASGHAGEFSIYRLHLADPVPFRRSLRATVEHGHGNTCNAYYQSVAFWYGSGSDSSAEPVYIDSKAKFGNPGKV